jgi:pimeloyl-ACP methyl ester carboxylesterase
MPIATRKNERLYYHLEGEGPPLVLIRGLSRSLRFWPEEFLEPLRERFSIVLFDHRGIGRSELGEWRFHIEDMADDLAAILEHAGIARAHVFGISLGGMVAQELALRHRERIDRLVLGATYGHPRRPGPRFASFAHLLTGSAMKSPRGQRLQGRVLLTPRFVRERPDIPHGWHERLLAEPMNKRAVVRQMIAALKHNTWDRLDRLDMPTLVITGDDDRLIPMRNSELLAERIPAARLEVLPGLGHDFPAQSPKVAAGHLVEFFAAGAKP